MLNTELRDALASYDRTGEVIRALSQMRQKIVQDPDTRKRDRLQFYDEEDQLVYETEMETLAFYYPQVGLYAWSWAIPSRRQNTTFLARQVLQYCLNNQVSLYTRTILTTGRTIIKDATQIDINLALAITLIRRPYILPQVFVDPYLESDQEGGIITVGFVILLDDGPLDAWCRSGIPPSPVESRDDSQ